MLGLNPHQTRSAENSPTGFKELGSAVGNHSFHEVPRNPFADDNFGSMAEDIYFYNEMDKSRRRGSDSSITNVKSREDLVMDAAMEEQKQLDPFKNAPFPTTKNSAALSVKKGQGNTTDGSIVGSPAQGSSLISSATAAILGGERAERSRYCRLADSDTSSVSSLSSDSGSKTAVNSGMKNISAKASGDSLRRPSGSSSDASSTELDPRLPEDNYRYAQLGDDQAVYPYPEPLRPSSGGKRSPRKKSSTTNKQKKHSSSKHHQPLEASQQLGLADNEATSSDNGEGGKEVEDGAVGSVPLLESDSDTDDVGSSHGSSHSIGQRRKIIFTGRSESANLNPHKLAVGSASSVNSFSNPFSASSTASPDMVLKISSSQQNSKNSLTKQQTENDGDSTSLIMNVKKGSKKASTSSSGSKKKHHLSGQSNNSEVSPTDDPFMGAPFPPSSGDPFTLAPFAMSGKSSKGDNAGSKQRGGWRVFSGSSGGKNSSQGRFDDSGDAKAALLQGKLKTFSFPVYSFTIFSLQMVTIQCLLEIPSHLSFLL